MGPLDMVALAPLMDLTSGHPDVTIALIDGPVASTHPELSAASIRELSGGRPGSCVTRDSVACAHGTSVAGVLAASRGSAAPAICPECTLLVYPILAEATDPTRLPTATPGELAEAVVRCVDAGACVINLSVALDRPTSREERDLEQALDFAARRAVITIAAAGNQSTIGSSPITRHPWVIPVVACDRRGLPVAQSNVGRSIGARGLCAPGDRIPTLGTGSGAVTFGGTSAAAPFVTGAIALLRSVFPRATATAVLLAVAPRTRRRAVVPPLMNAWSAYRTLESTIGGEVA